MNSTFQKGKKAEEIVENILINKGWRILARNFRGPGFEVDLIAESNKILAAIEVKHFPFAKCELSYLTGLFKPRKIFLIKKGIARFLEKNNSLHQYFSEYKIYGVIVDRKKRKAKFLKIDY